MVVTAEIPQSRALDQKSVQNDLTHWPLPNFHIFNDIVLQWLARQAPAAQDAAGACLAGYYS